MLGGKVLGPEEGVVVVEVGAARAVVERRARRRVWGKSILAIVLEVSSGLMILVRVS
jgi:hypothetical protein